MTPDLGPDQMDSFDQSGSSPRLLPRSPSKLAYLVSRQRLFPDQSKLQKDQTKNVPPFWWSFCGGAVKECWKRPAVSQKEESGGRGVIRRSDQEAEPI